LFSPRNTFISQKDCQLEEGSDLEALYKVMLKINDKKRPSSEHFSMRENENATDLLN